MAKKDEPAAFARGRLKQGYDDGLFKERDASLADVLDDSNVAVDDEDDDEDVEEVDDWDPDHRSDA